MVFPQKLFRRDRDPERGHIGTDPRGGRTGHPAGGSLWPDLFALHQRAAPRRDRRCRLREWGSGAVRGLDRQSRGAGQLQLAHHLGRAPAPVCEWPGRELFQRRGRRWRWSDRPGRHALPEGRHQRIPDRAAPANPHIETDQDAKADAYTETYQNTGAAADGDTEAAAYTENGHTQTITYARANKYQEAETTDAYG